MMKNKRISRRLALQITGLLISFSVVLLLANSLLLKPLYERSIKNNMQEGIEALSQLDYSLSMAELSTDISTISQNSDFDVTVIYLDNVIYSSSAIYGVRGAIDQFEGEIGRDEHRELEGDKDKKAPLPHDTVEKWDELSEGISIGSSIDPNNKFEAYIMTTSIDDSTHLYLTQNLEPIRDSISQANALLISVSIVFLMVGIFVAFFVSRRFTSPIREMQGHVDRLSHLDFGDTLEISTGDELEDLSGDINTLATKLETALSNLQEKNDLLEREIEAQRKFISNASHELRTPLALIKGYSDEIAGGFVKSADQEHMYVGYIAEESAKMKRLLNEILELSRVESGRMELTPVETSVKECIENFMDKYSGFVDEHHLKTSLDLDEGKGYFDVIRFEQILANYVSNAGKYSDSSKLMSISCKKLDNVYRVTVKNSGQPIPDQVKRFIWDGFYKGDEARTSANSSGGSYGLGLSIVKALQEMADQDYGCYDEEGYVAFWFDVKAV